MVANPNIYGLIFMFNHYKQLASSCFDTYPDICDAYLCYDHYMIHVQYYERAILAQL